MHMSSWEALQKAEAAVAGHLPSDCFPCCWIALPEAVEGIILASPDWQSVWCMSNSATVQEMHLFLCESCLFKAVSLNSF